MERRRILEARWDQLRGKVKETWGDLSDDDLKKIEGKFDRLVGIIKEKTGESAEAVERRLDQLIRKA